METNDWIVRREELTLAKCCGSHRELGLYVKDADGCSTVVRGAIGGIGLYGMEWDGYLSGAMFRAPLGAKIWLKDKRCIFNRGIKNMFFVYKI